MGIPGKSRERWGFSEKIQARYIYYTDPQFPEFHKSDKKPLEASDPAPGAPVLRGKQPATEFITCPRQGWGDALMVQ